MCVKLSVKNPLSYLKYTTTLEGMIAQVKA